MEKLPPPNRPKRKLKIFMTLAVLVFLAIILFRHATQPKPTSVPAVPVVVAPVVKKNLMVGVHANGNVTANISVAVKSQVDGVITQVSFKEGQFVKAGDLLFTIDPRPFQVALLQAQANLARDTANLHYAQATLARNAKLVPGGYVTKDTYQQLKSQAEALEATVKADEAAVASAQLNLNYCFIRSPIDGRTGARLVDIGNVIKTAAGQTLVFVNQITPVLVSFNLPEAYLSGVRNQFQQGPVQVVVTLPQNNLQQETGQLTLIDNTINNTTGTFLLKARFENTDYQLWPGQFANVSLPLAELDGVLVVPSQAIQQGQNGLYVFVARSDNTAEYREIKTGPSKNNETVVIQGLSEGEKVVTSGQFQLQNGSQITVQKTIPTVPQSPAQLQSQLPQPQRNQLTANKSP